MKRKVKKERTETREETEGIQCDFCGRWTDTDLDWLTECGGVEDPTGPDFIETEEIELKEGYRYPGVGSGTEWSFDICPDCFKTKIVPLALPDRRAPKDWCY